MILRSNERTVQDFIADFREEFKKLPVEDIAFPRSVNGIEKYSDSQNVYKKGTPIHVCGTLMYNNGIEKYKLNKKYQKIREGEKIKFVYLKEPNPFKSHVISFLNSLPKEFDLNSYVDYDSQFDKAFVEPLKLILDKIDWKVEKINTLEDFFA